MYKRQLPDEARPPRANVGRTVKFAHMTVHGVKLGVLLVAEDVATCQFAHLHLVGELDGVPTYMRGYEPEFLRGLLGGCDLVSVAQALKAGIVALDAYQFVVVATLGLVKLRGGLVTSVASRTASSSSSSHRAPATTSYTPDVELGSRGAARAMLECRTGDRNVVVDVKPFERVINMEIELEDLARKARSVFEGGKAFVVASFLGEPNANGALLVQRWDGARFVVDKVFCGVDAGALEQRVDGLLAKTKCERARILFDTASIASASRESFARFARRANREDAVLGVVSMSGTALTLVEHHARKRARQREGAAVPSSGSEG